VIVEQHGEAVTALGDASIVGVIAGIGHLAAMPFQIAISPNIPRPPFYGVVNAPFFIVTSVTSGVISEAMR